MEVVLGKVKGTAPVDRAEGGAGMSDYRIVDGDERDGNWLFEGVSM